jgi:hypothetical protein
MPIVGSQEVVFSYKRGTLKGLGFTAGKEKATVLMVLERGPSCGLRRMKFTVLRVDCAVKRFTG